MIKHFATIWVDKGAGIEGEKEREREREWVGGLSKHRHPPTRPYNVSCVCVSHTTANSCWRGWWPLSKPSLVVLGESAKPDLRKWLKREKLFVNCQADNETCSKPLKLEQSLCCMWQQQQQSIARPDSPWAAGATPGTCPLDVKCSQQLKWKWDRILAPRGWLPADCLSLSLSLSLYPLLLSTSLFLQRFAK